MPNILKKEVTEGSESVNSVNNASKHIFTITDIVHEDYKIP